MSNLDEFMKDPWKKINEMRNTPHVCDYDYRFDLIGGQPAFFEICKLCFDTNGVVEISADLD